MHVRIDFAPPGWHVSLRQATLILASALALGGTLWNIYDSITEYQASRNALIRFEPDRRPALVLTPTEIDAINQAVRELNLPWNDFFQAIEAHVGERVALLSLEPDAANRTVRISAEAKSADVMLDFVAALAHESPFQKVQLSHHEINEGDRNKPFRFAIDAGWDTQ